MFDKIINSMVEPETITGFSIFLNNQIWKDNYGCFIFPSYHRAYQVFYRDFHWRLRMYCYDNNIIYRTRKTFQDFKIESNFEIKPVSFNIKDLQ